MVQKFQIPTLQPNPEKAWEISTKPIQVNAQIAKKTNPHIAQTPTPRLQWPDCTNSVKACLKAHPHSVLNDSISIDFSTQRHTAYPLRIPSVCTIDKLYNFKLRKLERDKQMYLQAERKAQEWNQQK